MTYCFAFKAPPDGFAIISDTRISSEIGGVIEIEEGDYLKVFSPRKNSFITFSGKLWQLKSLLLELPSYLASVDEKIQFERLESFLKLKYSEMWQRECFSEKNYPSMELIYGDIRHKRGSMQCRLARYDLGIKNGKPAIAKTMGKKIEWVSIGWTPDGRRLLSNAAADALCELESRGLDIRSCAGTKASGSYLELGNGALGVILDSSGVRNSSFRKVLRSYANNLEHNKSANIKFEPMLIFGGVAQNAIEYAMEDARKIAMPYSDYVGSNWTLATLTQRFGFVVHSNHDLNFAL